MINKLNVINMEVSKMGQSAQAIAPHNWPYVDPPIFESFWFENFNASKCMKWMENNWTISLHICTIYLAFIFWGTRWMKNRPAFELRGPLAAWNLGLTIFSVFGFLRCAPELLYVLMGPNGFHRSVCVRDSHNQPAAFWAWLFTLSKVVELGDTVFIVLRKKELQFIHYYHHGVALIICFCFHSDYSPVFRYYGTINYLVHSILYGYLYLRAINIKLPRLLSQVVIVLELLQMLVGVIVNGYAIWVKVNGGACEQTMQGIVCQMTLYLSFVILFAYLFIKSPSSSDAKSKRKLN